MTTLRQLCTYAISRSLGPRDTLGAVLTRQGFVQADPIRAPARAQDLTLRQRVQDYKNGDLDRQYGALPIEEDFFVNYGFVPRALQPLMHPRTARRAFTPLEQRRARQLLAYVAEQGVVHPRDVESHFAHGKVRNYWGGSSNATTHLLDGLHYRGLLSVVRREAGIRLYGLRAQTPPASTSSERRARLDALIDVIVSTYAPLPTRSLHMLIGRVRHATPQWQPELRAAIVRAKQRLAHVEIGGVTYHFPAQEAPTSGALDGQVRLLTPFDPIVWDRLRFELFWGWAYRFEAYTPLARRKLGYYALPLLYRGEVIGWSNVSVVEGKLDATFGYVSGKAPRERAFKVQRDDELDRLRAFMCA